MCIIAYAPANSVIKEDTIKYMFQGNPDGAGLMWKPNDNSPVEIRKGFFKVEDLIKAYNEIPVECEKAIHCRIATSGKISVGCCHPFPVRAKVDAMMQAKDRAGIALMHNGMIDYCTPVQGMKSPYSDSMLFAKRFLYPLAKQLDQECIQELIENSTSSRLLIMRQGRETLTFGNWKFEDGVYYSNGNYKEQPKTYGKYWGGCYGYGGYSYTGATGKKSTSVATPYDSYSIYDDECFGYAHAIDEDVAKDLEALQVEQSYHKPVESFLQVLAPLNQSIEKAIDAIVEALETHDFFVIDYDVEKHDQYQVVNLTMEGSEAFSKNVTMIGGYEVLYSTPL